MVAASGSGKTSALYRYLCKNYGILMVNCDPSEAANESSDLASSLCVQRLDAAVTMKTLGGVLHSSVYCLFLARVLWLMYVASSLKELKACSARFLLLAQINGMTRYPQRILLSLLDDHKLDRAPRAMVLKLAQDALNNLFEMIEIGVGENFLICIDEAHVYLMLNRLSGSDQIFSVSGTSRPGNLLSIQTECITQIKQGLTVGCHMVFSGTQYVEDVLYVLRSAAGLEFKLYHISPELLKSSAQVIEYFEKHITLDDETMLWLRSSDFSKKHLPARRRIMANALQYLGTTSCLKEAIQRAKSHFIQTIASRLVATTRRINPQ